MFENLEIFRMANGLARHSATRQEVIARNVANADTPKYRAKDVQSFVEAFDHAQTSRQTFKATRAGHITPHEVGLNWIAEIDTPEEASPNGNTVSLEAEMMKSSETRHQHELALSVYRSSMTILRMSIGRS
ncbi:FlgB family protein [Celeribacter sp.]|uniref:FlgB family protein n=1 Tax=Celeribacter sp. TaxID=1890673 RepID=UPI003A8D0D06